MKYVTVRCVIVQFVLANIHSNKMSSAENIAIVVLSLQKKKHPRTRHGIINLKLLLSVAFLINREKLGEKWGDQHP